MDQIITIGLDIAKSVFQVHGVDAAGAPVLRRQLRAVAAPPGRHRGLAGRRTTGRGS